MNKKLIYAGLGTLILSLSSFSAVAGSAKYIFTWEKCADQGQTCDPAGAAALRYGRTNSYLGLKKVAQPFLCDNATLFNPKFTPYLSKIFPTGTVNACERLVKVTDTPPAVAGGTWVQCASQYLTCEFTGTQTIAYGANGKYNTLTLTAPSGSKGVLCDNSVFGNPVDAVYKHCSILKSTTPPPPVVLDGKALFDANCASCHESVNHPEYETGADAAATSKAIIEEAEMNTANLKALTAAEIKAIADYAAKVAPPPPPPPVVVTPTVKVEVASVTEGGILSHVITLSSAPTAAVSYPINLAGTTAVVGEDFTANPSFTDGVVFNGSAIAAVGIAGVILHANGTITVPAGVTSFKVSYPTIDDANVESSKTTALKIGGVTGVGTILDNDVAVVINPTVIVNGASVIEGGSLSHAVTLSSAPTVAVSYAIALNSAFATTANLSFTGGVVLNTNGTITVPAGVGSFAVSYPTIDDVAVKPNETTSLTIGGATGVGTVLDNDVVVAPALNGKALFDKQCASCHYKDIEPDYPADYAKGTDLAATTNAIVKGLYGMGTAKLRALTAAELKAIADYGASH